MFSGETSKNLLFWRASSNEVASSSQSAISSWFCFLKNLGHSSDQIVSGLVVVCTGSTICPFGFFIPIIAQSVLRGVVYACSRRRSSQEWGMFLVWERTNLIDVPLMTVNEGTTHAPEVLSVLFFEACFFLFFLHRLARSFPLRGFHHGDDGEDRRV